MNRENAQYRCFPVRIASCDPTWAPPKPSDVITGLWNKRSAQTFPVKALGMSIVAISSRAPSLIVSTGTSAREMRVPDDPSASAAAVGISGLCRG